MSECDCGPNNRGSRLSSRLFLRDTGAGVVALSAMGKAIPVMAGPLSVDYFESLIPTDKKLSRVSVEVGSDVIEHDHHMQEDRVPIKLTRAVTIKAGEHIEVEIKW